MATSLLCCSQKKTVLVASTNMPFEGITSGGELNVCIVLALSSVDRSTSPRA